MVLVACGTRPQQPAAHPDWSYNSVVYEMNVRQYTPEGTLAEAARHLPRLQEMGVDVVWLMPVYPIGVKERKGTLGSYYAISDYEAVNPEFGTLEDFDRFLAEAHRLGLRVILDWVANHTSPDHPWVTGKPADWYVRDAEGNTIVEYDWTDIAKLNYESKEMRAEMEKSMRFWLDRGIDGFRCDVAYQVPQDFWADVFSKFRSEYSRRLYFLAEGEEPWLHEAGFDATYAWKLHHLLNDIAQDSLDKAMATIEKNLDRQVSREKIRGEVLAELEELGTTASEDKIAQIVERRLRAEVERGVESANEASEAIRQIGDGSREAVSIVGEITVAIQEQASAMNSIAQQVERIAQMSEESSAAAGNSAQIARDLDTLASEVQQIVGAYKL